MSVRITNPQAFGGKQDAHLTIPLCGSLPVVTLKLSAKFWREEIPQRPIRWNRGGRFGVENAQILIRMMAMDERSNGGQNSALNLGHLVREAVPRLGSRLAAALIRGTRCLY